jgi:hypothetical protein
VPRLRASESRRIVTQGRRGYLSASEVGNFTYCPEAWYLQRLGHRPEQEALRRLHAGTRAHRRIGRTTGQLFRTDGLRRALLLVLIVLVALLVLNALGLLTLSVPH